jgi:drug/metabolite transporter (DMT)-like permease
MPDQDFDYRLNEFQARPKAQRWWLKALIACAVIGGIYGAAIGSAISTTAGAAEVIGIVAAFMALLCGVPGARFGLFLGTLNRWRFGRLSLGVLAAIGGAILGGLLGLIAVLPLGAILGAMGGSVLSRSILRRGFLPSLVGQVLGVLLGACIGVTALTLSQSPSAALVGIAWGLGIGVIVGPLPLLLFAKMMDSLAPKRDTEDTIIDVEVREVRNDKD